MLQNRNTMLQAMETYFPQEVSWTVPQGGLFLWVHLPDELPIQVLCQEALAHNILIAPGSAFFPDQQGYSAMRLNFSQSPAEIEKGIAILGSLLKQHLAKSRQRSLPQPQFVAVAV
jgi:DNA-binding transcriptional MocR family regulator